MQWKDATMVVEVVYHRDSTLLSIPSYEEEGRVEDSSMNERVYEMERDTSHTNRNCGDDTRQSVHYNSILNCTGETEDEDDEMEEPGSFLFGDDDEFHSPLNQSLSDDADVALVVSSPASPPSQQKALCCVNDRWLDTSLQNVTDSFVSLCSSRPEEGGACTVSEFAWNASETCSRQLQYQVELDLLHLLGCDSEINSSTATFGQVSWFSPLAIKAPAKGGRPAVRRSNPRQRAQRIRRLRHELLGPVTAPMVSPTRSMDDGLERWIGKGMDPIAPEDGYDSDPGEMLLEQERLRNDSLRETSLLDEEENDDEYHFYDGHRERLAEEYNMRMQYQGPKDAYDREVYEAVQEAMNCTWTLSWHAEGNPMPMCIHFWVERGTMLNQGAVVVEPKFMWRQVYQPNLATHRRLSDSFLKPMDVRVLNACRIVEAGERLDRSKYPMARSACSLFLKTCRDEVFLFEASSPEEKEQIIRQWKLVVARLASLAVIEDMEAMAKEFFTPAVNAQMLITNDD